MNENSQALHDEFAQDYPRIRVLPEEIATQIAAGEVVDRPASIVRELVDNAIDAGAKTIEVSFEQGGISSVSVTDDGSGMSVRDAEVAFQRHATSKLETLDDLDRLSTRGFRGEALPSIASVARVMLQTRPHNAPRGVCIRVEGGQLVQTQSVMSQPGTKVDVRHLFFNTPARRKFLRSARAEGSRIVELVKKVALTAHDIEFRILQDGECIATIPSTASRLDRARSFVTGTLAVVERRIEGAEVRGIITFGAHGTSDFDSLVLCVNDRVIFDKTVVRAVRQACKGMLHSGEQPQGVLFLNLPPELVDVNVHPQKSEVRFADSQFVFRFVYGAIAASLKDFKAIPAAEVGRAEIAHQATDFMQSSYLFPRRTGAAESALQLSDTSASYSTNGQESLLMTSRLTLPRTSSAHVKYSELRYIGAIHRCYLLCESQQGLVLVDMHAAHERINYNRILAQLESKSLQRQPLLLPIEIHVGSSVWDSLIEQRDVVQQYGFSLQFPRSPMVIIEEVPQVLMHAARKIEIVRDLLAAVAEERDDPLARHLDRVASRLACHASIRSGDDLTTEEVYRLFAELEEAELGAACPHGRPVAVFLTLHELERLFGRA